MQAMEVKKILDRIQANRPSFMVNDNVTREWRNVLQDYSFDDVNSKLTDFLKDERNFGRYPDPYYITKYLKTEVEKNNPTVIHTVKCKNCGEVVKYEKYDQHLEQCNSADYLIDVSKKWLHKDLNKDKLMQADTLSFEKYYYQTLYQVYNVMPDGFQKHLLKNVLLTYEGKEPEFNLEELMKEFNN